MFGEQEKEKLIEIINKANKEAKNLFTQYKQDKNKLKIETKSDGSMVTKIDKIINDLIISELAKVKEFDNITMISEENSKPNYDDRKNDKYIWLLDPIDGTHDMIEFKENFTICLGLLENNIPIFGIVGVPMKDMIIYGGENFDVKINGEAPKNENFNININTKKKCSIGEEDFDFDSEKINSNIKYNHRIIYPYNNYFGYELLIEEINEVIQPIAYFEWDICAWEAILKHKFKIKNLKTLEDIKYNTKDLKIPAYIIYKDDEIEEN